LRVQDLHGDRFARDGVAREVDRRQPSAPDFVKYLIFSPDHTANHAQPQNRDGQRDYIIGPPDRQGKETNRSSNYRPLFVA
jgi:hypothetical protein